jgi:hypothetical protein
MPGIQCSIYALITRLARILILQEYGMLIPAFAGKTEG